MRIVRAAVIRLGFAVISLLMCLVLIEIGTRIAGHAKGVDFSLYMHELSNSDRLPKYLRIPHPTLRWSLNPGEQVLAVTSDFSVVYKINSKGLRDEEYPYEKPPAKIRIVALGDSLTFGEGVPYGDRFTDIAERLLANVEILTMGVPGYGLDQMLLMCAEEGTKYHPDVVLLVVAWTVASRHVLGTDWLDGTTLEHIAAGALTAASPNPTIYRQEHDDRLRPRRSALLRRSWFLSYLDYQITLWRLRPAMIRADLNVWGERTLNDTRPASPSPEIERLNAYLRAGLRRLTPLATKLKFQVVIANIDPNWRPEIDLEDLAVGTVMLDFSADLRAAAVKRSLRFKYDPHFNPQTHRLLGELLAAGLRKHVPGVVE